MDRTFDAAAVMAILAVLGGAGCSRETAADVQRFQLTGVVVGREASPARIVVAHEAVGGLMPAMTMGFETKETPPPMREGDRILATLVLGGGTSWLEDVRVTGRDAGGEGLPTARRATAGAIVPRLELVDQDGTPTTLPDTGGRVTIVTFLYTRCPMPDLCPLMVQHLEGVRQRLNDAGLGDRFRLVGVTLDPSFDTPPVLRAYGQSLFKRTGRFDQWTLATGTARQIEEAAVFFGVGYRAERGFVTHTLTTAVIGHDGRVIRMFESNSWRPGDLFDVVRGGTERAAAH